MLAAMPTASARGRFVSTLLAWAEAGNLRQFPWRGEKDSYKLLLTEVFLRRTRAENVVPVHHSFFQSYPDLEAFLTADDKVLRALVAPLGLRWRAENLIQLRERLKEDGRIPNSYEGLTGLPGVGDYVASAVLCFAHGQRRPLIDTNLVRLLGRYFGFETGAETRRRRWFIELAHLLVPAHDTARYNYATLDFAAKLCKSMKPNIEGCPMKNRCSFARGVSGQSYDRKRTKSV